MTHRALHCHSVRTLAALIRGRQLTSRQIVDAFIERIETKDGKVNAVVVRDFETARAAADAADSETAAGTTASKRALHGVPITVKERFDVSGLRTLNGTAATNSKVCGADSTVVAKLKAAGAIILGKTNVPLNSADWQAYNAVFGCTSNPWDLSRTPGGSSGGSAAALAAGFTPAEVGTDIGGSIRVPSSFCGLYGHKPTFGLISSGTPGVAPLAPADLSVAGPMAHSAADLALLLDVLVLFSSPCSKLKRLLPSQ